MVSRTAARVAVGATAVEAVVLCIVGAAMAELRRSYAGTPPAWVGAGIADWLTHVGAAPLFALTIAVFAHGRGAVAGLLSTRLAVHLGDLAYGVYVLHIAVLTLDVWPRLATAAGPGVAALLCSAALLALAHAAWRLVELPARRAIVQAFDRRRVALPSPAAPDRLPNA